MEEENVCEICYENYNLEHKIPKILDCCKKVYCLNCLNSIYKKNVNKILCPICRKLINKSPKDLKIDAALLEPKLVCPNCKRYVSNKKLNIEIKQNTNNNSRTSILCENCCPNKEISNLREYLNILIEEMGYFIKHFEKFNSITFDSIINSHINSFVDKLIENLKLSLRDNLKNRILEIINGNNYKKLRCFDDFDYIKSCYNKLISLYEKQIKKSEELEFITNTINIYIEKNDKLKEDLIDLKKINESFVNNKVIILDEFFNTQDVGSFITNYVNFNLNNQQYKFCKEDKNHSCFIFNKCDLSQKFDDTFNKQNESQIFNSRESDIFSETLNNKDIRFNLINLQDLNSLKTFTKFRGFDQKYFYVENFNFNFNCNKQLNLFNANNRLLKKYI